MQLKFYIKYFQYNLEIIERSMTVREFWYSLSREGSIFDSNGSRKFHPFFLYASSVVHFLHSVVFRQTSKTTQLSS